MRNATRWAIFSYRGAQASHRNAAAFWRSCRRFLSVCLYGLGALALAGSFAQAATIKSGDILVVDTGNGKLFRVDPQTGVRTVITDFRNSSQGPVDQSFLGGISMAGGRIFVTAATTGIYSVDPATGTRTLVSNFAQGTFQGDIFGSAVDSFGHVIVNWAKPQFGGAPRAIVNVDPRSDARTIVTDLTNPAQGDSFNCCVAYFTDLALEHSGSIVAGVTWFAPVGPSRDTGDLYRVNPASGQRTLLSDFSNAAQGVTQVVPSTGIATDPSGQILVNTRGTSTASTARDLLVRVDPATGSRTVVSDFDNAAQGTPGRRLSGIALEQSATHVDFIVGASVAANVAAQPSLLFRVNPQTGQRTLLSDSSNAQQGPPFSWIDEITVVP
ncbi:PQQ-binding-like beta-propeller repeat protein [Trinickia sp. EG282A]|uniref:PQQ-binding-like beta-propeller repeat protein n=1 Tax=Trinickia sp. EG282A TaxID=3237013 RepID=UPI0034D180FE